VAQQPNTGLDRLIVVVSRSNPIRRTDTGRTLVNEWSPCNRGRYLHNTQQKKKTNIHALSCIRTRDPSNQFRSQRNSPGPRSFWMIRGLYPKQMSGSWVCSKERCFDVFFGAKQGKGLCRKRYNYELYEKLNEPNIVNYIKVKILAWAGHLMRTNNDRTIKKIFNAKPNRVRRVGRPKLR